MGIAPQIGFVGGGGSMLEAKHLQSSGLLPPLRAFACAPILARHDLAQ